MNSLKIRCCSSVRTFSSSSFTRMCCTMISLFRSFDAPPDAILTPSSPLRILYPPATECHPPLRPPLQQRETPAVPNFDSATTLIDPKGGVERFEMLCCGQRLQGRREDSEPRMGECLKFNARVERERLQRPGQVCPSSACALCK